MTNFVRSGKIDPLLTRAEMPAPRRLPPPWMIDETDACFIARSAAQPRSTRDEARPHRRQALLKLPGPAKP